MSVVSAAPQVATVAAAGALNGERTGLLEPGVWAAIQRSGFARHFVPSSWGGAEGSFVDCVDAVAMVAQGDPSAGWCAAVVAGGARIATHLPRQGQHAIWKDGPDVVVSTALQPSGRAEAVDGGWRVSGRWPYLTGILDAQWALLSCETPEPDSELAARMLLVPHGSYTVEQTWSNVGMSATASHTAVLEDVLVPYAHSFPRAGLLSGRQNAGVPHSTASALMFAAPLLGAARAALDAWLVEVSTASEARRLRVARAAVEINAAEVVLRNAAAEADRSPLPTGRAARAACDCAVAVEWMTGAVDRLFHAAGNRHTAAEATFQRMWRDAHAGSIHPALQFDLVARDFATDLFRDVGVSPQGSIIHGEDRWEGRKV